MSQAAHVPVIEPSPWVRRWIGEIPADGDVLDVACGSGRHVRLLAAQGYQVVAVDRDAASIASLRDCASVVALQADMETGAWPYPGRRFAGIVVTNYLHRPLLPLLVDSLTPGGVLIYETFALGNARFGRPSNPEFLLRPGELLEAVRGRLRVIAYEDVQIDAPKPAMVQRICARQE